MGKPLSFFGGMIPLFIQWTDIHVHEFISQNDPVLDKYFKDLYEAMIQDFEKYMRLDVIYVTVCQDDQGLCIMGCYIINLVIVSSSVPL